MPPFRAPKERIDLLARRMLDEMAKSSMVEIVEADTARAIVRNLVTENLREEHEIEQEVVETLRKHGQKIYEHDADFQKLIVEGKKILAKKRKFPL